MAYQKIRILTDSVSDIPVDLIKKWDLTVVPTYVNYDGGSFADDGVELDRKAFYDAMPTLKTFPTTSAPSPGVAEEKLRHALDNSDHVICINVPEKLSATLNAVRLASKELDESRVTIVDSQTLTAAAGMQVLVAAEVAHETGNVEAVLDAVRRVRENQRLYAIIDNMENLRRSGRVSGLVAHLGSFLKIKPIVDVWEGEVLSAARPRTMSKAQDTLQELLEAYAPLDKLIVLHVANEEGAIAFKEKLGDLAPANTQIMEIGPTLGTHVGRGAVGAVPLSMKWRA